MRNNSPITTSERTFSADVKLISVTDKGGKIQDCNDAFVEISGFEREELIGQPHNIVRHPQMPPLAFEVMWEHLKAGKPWMGLVKNRCKNGDFYWVDAYVTPISDGGKIVGYESVRSCPKRADVARAEKLYARISDGKGLNKSWPVSPPNLFIIVAALLTAALYLAGAPAVSEALLMIAVIAYAVFVARTNGQLIAELRGLLDRSFSHDLAAQSYTDKKGSVGNLQVAILSQYAHLTTVITRIQDAAGRVAKETLKSSKLMEGAKGEIDRQQAETIQVAAAMNEMTTTISEVSKHVSDTASSAETAFDLAQKGNVLSENTSMSIEKLRNTVQTISHSVSDVSEQTNKIATAAQMIEQIADQTNLLALNAAIEAARAGEQGRGFAVVAEEVRNLAKRTQESTLEIYSIVQLLTEKASEAVSVAEKGTADADEGLSKVIESGEMLNGIVSAAGNIADMSTQMAAAVEEQSHVAEDINRQIVRISTLADSNTESADETQSSLNHLNTIADELHELVVRFK